MEFRKGGRRERAVEGGREGIEGEGGDGIRIRMEGLIDSVRI